MSYITLGGNPRYNCESAIQTTTHKTEVRTISLPRNVLLITYHEQTTKETELRNFADTPKNL